MERYTVFVGSIAALGLSPLITVMTGESNFYALSLFPLLVVLWYFTRLSEDEIGVKRGHFRTYLIAFFYPVIVMGVTGLICWMTGSIQAINTSVVTIAEQVVVLFFFTFIIALATEEGFFRGWLFAALHRCDVSPWRITIWTSFVFALWHFAVPFVVPDGRFPAAFVPFYLVNCFLVGIIWGLLRWDSGSIGVTALSHSVWNALTYTLYGYGTGAGVLAISSYHLDPERGILGVLLNIIAFILLWQWRFKDILHKK